MLSVIIKIGTRFLFIVIGVSLVRKFIISNDKVGIFERNRKNKISPVAKNPKIFFLNSGSMNARCTADDMRSHVSHASHFSTKPIKQPRSIADGQSQHSFSNQSTRYLSGSNAFAGLVNSRPGKHIASPFNQT